MPLMKIFGAFNGNNRISKAANAIIAAEKINILREMPVLKWAYQR